MEALVGTIVNGLAIIVGSLLGVVGQRISDKTKETVMQAISLAVMILGIQMALKSEHFLIVIASLIVGSVLGERWQWEEKLNAVGRWVEHKMGAASQGSIARAFVTATLVFVVGALAIVGALDSGLRHDHTVLYTKSMLDGFTSFLFSATLGIGVIFSAIPVLLYQGAIALLASQIDLIVPGPLMDQLINEMTATGGVMILAIGLNLLNVLSVRVANILPSLLITIFLVTVSYYQETFIQIAQTIF